HRLPIPDWPVIVIPVAWLFGDSIAYKTLFLKRVYSLRQKILQGLWRETVQGFLSSKSSNIWLSCGILLSTPHQPWKTSWEQVSTFILAQMLSISALSANVVEDIGSGWQEKRGNELLSNQAVGTNVTVTKSDGLLLCSIKIDPYISTCFLPSYHVLTLYLPMLSYDEHGGGRHNFFSKISS
ncbi:hypothetical protein DL96DRAFT_1617824, partial [Flagelloscypha sp. PMI_526]